MTLIYLVAGEASGDVLGGRLIAALRTARPELEFAGIGGERMAEQGVESLFPVRDLAVMGLLEVLPKLRVLRARMRQAVADIAARRPDVVVTIDSPGFTLRLLRRIAPLGLRRVHYVAPQVWAWRESRVKKYPGLWDRLLCLLPFEPAFFARHGLVGVFVGHPVLESSMGDGDGARFRAAHGIAPAAKLLLVLPGSRAGEISRLLPVFSETMRQVAGALPGLRLVLVAAPGMDDFLARSCASWPGAPVVVSTLEDKRDAFAAADAALTKSGTSTLELALAGVPMAVAYRVNPLTAAIAYRLVKVRFASLVNLLADRAVIPEMIQIDCTAPRLAAALQRLLTDPATAAAQRAGFAEVLAQLTPAGGLPSAAAARAVLDLLEPDEGTST